ncbi:MAG: SDR family oxidoreductase [Myxococcota bacterium]
MQVKRFEGRVVLVTGAAQGQGAAEVAGFAAEGARVWACDLQSDFAAPPGVERATLDVTDPSAWERVVAHVRERDDRLDVLVNNAGISLGKGVLGTALDEWKAVLDVNLSGAFHGMRACFPLMKETGGGSIVNTGTATSLHGFYRAPYSASKWGLRGLSKCAALEFARFGIRVNTIHPGLVESPMATRDPAMYEAILEPVPIGRPTSAEEITRLVLFLASDDAASITGADHLIDGGLVAAGAMNAVANKLSLWD